MYINFKAINIILKSPIGCMEKPLLIYLVEKIINKEELRTELLNRLNDRLIENLTLINKGLFIEIDGEGMYSKEVYTDFETATHCFNQRICEAVREHRNRETYNKTWVKIIFLNNCYRFRYDLDKNFEMVDCLKSFMLEDLKKDIEFANENNDFLNEKPSYYKAQNFLKAIY